MRQRLLFGVVFLVGLLILGFTYGPLIGQELGQIQRSRQPADKNVVITPVNTDFGIVIPKIGANSTIVFDVDPFDSNAYQQALTRGVAHARGSVLPGDPGNSFLFSHSSVDFFRATQYNSVFYLLSKMEIGDRIFIYRDEQKFEFVVENKSIVSGTAIEYLSVQTETPTLTLMTCWPPGTNLKRLIITAGLL